MPSSRPIALSLLCLAALLCTHTVAKKRATPHHRAAVSDDMPDMVVYGQREDVVRFARQVAHRVLFMDEGRLVEEGTPAELFDTPREERTRRFLSNVL